RRTRMCRRARGRFRRPPPRGRNRPSAAADRDAHGVALADRCWPHRAAPPGGGDGRAQTPATALSPAGVAPPISVEELKKESGRRDRTADDIFDAVEDD